MNAPLGKGHTAVRAQKRARLSDGQPWQRHELFPTPPWATRALISHVLQPRGFARPDRAESAWEPAAGLGHMSAVLEETFAPVIATDVFDYVGDGPEAWPAGWFRAQDFLDESAETPVVDWVITNPPFSLAQVFLLRALRIAQHGIALLMRTQWFESEERFEQVFRHHPPTIVAQFAERVAMCEGGWDPQCSTATAYAWFVWIRRDDGFWQWPVARRQHAFTPEFDDQVFLDLTLIPPGQKRALTRPGDRALASRHVAGFVPPSLLRRTGKLQLSLSDDPAPAPEAVACATA